MRTEMGICSLVEDRYLFHGKKFNVSLIVSQIFISDD